MRVIDSFDFQGFCPESKAKSSNWSTSLAFVFPYLFYIHFEKFMQRINSTQLPPKSSIQIWSWGLKSFVEQEPKNHKQCDFASNYSKHILQFRKFQPPLLHTSIKLPELKKIDQNPFFHHNQRDYLFYGVKVAFSLYHYQTNVIFLCL